MDGLGALRSLPPRVLHFWKYGIWRHETWPPQSNRRLGRSIILVARVLYLVGAGFARERFRLRAAALTHVTLLSLVPALAVVFSVFTAFGGLQSVGERLKRMTLQNLVGRQQEQVIDYLERFIASAHAGQLGAIGTGFLFLTSIALLSDVERAFNDIWGVRRHRNFLQRFQVFWPLVTLGPILMGLSLSVTATLTANEWVRWAEDSLLGFHLVSQVASGALVCIFFGLVYHIVPNTAVRPHAAALGGLVSGLLWLVAQQLYAYYAAYSIALSALYGSLSAIPLFIIWVFVSWNVILLGAALTFAIQSSRSYEPDRRVCQDERERVAAQLALSVAQRFARGLGPSDAQALIDDAHVPPRVANRLLGELTDAGIFAEAQRGDELGFVPARPLEQITLFDVVRALRQDPKREAVHFEPRDPTARVVQSVLAQGEESQRNALGRTLAELVAEARQSSQAS